MALPDLFSDYTLRTVALGAAALGTTSGALGSFAVLRKQSLLGDAISHAALPGIALAFLLTGSKAPLVLVAGAAAAGWLGTLLVMKIVGSSRVREDSALGLVLAVFFGFGLVLLTYIQKRPDAAQAGLDRYLFGQAATLLQRDVVQIAALGALALGATALLWKEFKLLAFDPDFGASLGFSMRRVDVLLTSVLVLAIVIGLQTVGVVLMSAMVVAPAAAARQWTDRMGRMVVLAGLFGALSGVAGAVLSSTTERLPTGPTIVLCLTALVAFSLLFAPERGIVWGWVREQRNRRRLHTQAVLADLYALARQHPGQAHGHSVATLEALHPGAQHELAELESRGWAQRVGRDGWAITAAGEAEEERRGGEAEG
ncbi:MAG: iron chelate uptake ABC transporter family permease subunit [Gemmatimonadota bacterium]